MPCFILLIPFRLFVGPYLLSVIAVLFCSTEGTQQHASRAVFTSSQGVTCPHRHASLGPRPKLYRRQHDPPSISQMHLHKMTDRFDVRFIHQTYCATVLMQFTRQFTDNSLFPCASPPITLCRRPTVQAPSFVSKNYGHGNRYGLRAL